jgi:hypothetical protein
MGRLGLPDQSATAWRRTLVPDGQRLIGFGPSDDGKRATTVMLFDAVGTEQPIVVQVDSPFWSSSWQRLPS